MTTQLCADDWKEIAAKAQREAEQWRQNFDALQRALVGETGASGIEVAHALRKGAERYRWLRDNACTAQANTIGPIYRIDVQILGRWTLAAAVDAAMATRQAVGAA